ncbi:MAG: hypothetical protein PHW00_00340 [Clostridia bacterium]|nr:hypothetical protein [Clostridia bacterium]
MNKKLILIIALMVSVVSVILVSVYGKVADGGIPTVRVSEMFFDQTKGITIDSTGITKTLDLRSNEYQNEEVKTWLSIEEYITLNPSNATITDIKYSIDVGAEYATITQTGLLTVYSLDKDITVTIRSADTAFLKSDQVRILLKVRTSSQDVPGKIPGT